MIPRKLSHPDSEVTKLKLLWRENMTEGDRDYWRDQFESLAPRRHIRQHLRDRLGIQLLYDKQLQRFCRWLAEEELNVRVAEETQADYDELTARGLAPEQLNGELLLRMKQRALARGDFKLGATALTLDLKFDGANINHRRVDLELSRLMTNQCK